MNSEKDKILEDFTIASQDRERAELAKSSDDPRVKAAGKYLGIRNYRLDMEWDLNDTVVSLPQKLCETLRMHRFLRVAGVETPEGVPKKELAPTLARNIIDSAGIAPPTP